MSPSPNMQPWTDEDLGFVQDSEWPAWRIAEELGRTPQAVRSMRHKLRHGWSPKRALPTEWTKAEDAFLFANQSMTASEAAKHIDRTYEAILHRRKTLKAAGNDVRMGRNFSPFYHGGRSVLAKTCPDCGYLLQASWFRASNGAFRSKCTRCAFSKYQQPSGENIGSIERSRQWVEKVQAITLSHATNNGNPWTEADLKILADPDLNLVQKSFLLKRSYHATQGAASKHGFLSQPSLGDPERDQWIIDNPNAKEYAA